MNHSLVGPNGKVVQIGADYKENQGIQDAAYIDTHFMTSSPSSNISNTINGPASGNANPIQSTKMDDYGINHYYDQQGKEVTAPSGPAFEINEKGQKQYLLPNGKSVDPLISLQWDKIMEAAGIYATGSNIASIAANGQLAPEMAQYVKLAIERSQESVRPFLNSLFQQSGGSAARQLENATAEELEPLLNASGRAAADSFLSSFESVASAARTGLSTVFDTVMGSGASATAAEFAEWAGESAVALIGGAAAASIAITVGNVALTAYLIGDAIHVNGKSLDEWASQYILEATNANASGKNITIDPMEKSLDQIASASSQQKSQDIDNARYRLERIFANNLQPTADSSGELDRI